MKITAAILPLLFASSSSASSDAGLRTSGDQMALTFNNPPPLMTDRTEPMDAAASDGADIEKSKSTPKNSLFLPTPETCQQDIQSFCSHELPSEKKEIMNIEENPLAKLLTPVSPSSPEKSMRVLDNLFDRKDSTLVVHVYSLTPSSPGSEEAKMEQVLEDMITTAMVRRQAERHFESMVHSLLEHSSTVYASESASQDSPDGEIQEPFLEKDYYDPLYLSKKMSSYGKTLLEHKEEEADGVRRRLALQLSELPTDSSIRTEPLTRSTAPEEVDEEEDMVATSETKTDEDSEERIQTCLWNVIDEVSPECKKDLIRARNIVRCGYLMSEQRELTGWELFQSIILPILFAISLCGLFVYLVFLIDVDYDMDEDELYDYFDDYYGDEEILYDKDGNEVIVRKEAIVPQKEKVAYVAVPIQVV